MERPLSHPLTGGIRTEVPFPSRRRGQPSAHGKDSIAGEATGGDGSALTAGKTPTFLLVALEETLGPLLDRMQLVNGRMDAKSGLHEQVGDVTESAARVPTIGAERKLPPAVDTGGGVENAIREYTIGDLDFIIVWTDPALDAHQRAF